MLHERSGRVSINTPFLDSGCDLQPIVSGRAKLSNTGKLARILAKPHRLIGDEYATCLKKTRIDRRLSRLGEFLVLTGRRKLKELLRPVP
jgi:hypothetical protein